MSYLHSLHLASKQFAKNYPALFFGLIILIGITFSLTENVFTLIPLFILISSIDQLKLLLPLVVIAFLFGKGQKPFVDIKEDGLKGYAYFKIDEIKTKSSHFGEKTIYKGKIQSFTTDSKIKNIQVVLSLNQKKGVKRPKANRDYIILGVLKKQSDHQFFLIPDKTSDWQSVKGSYSFAETRYLMKKWVSKLIQKRLTDTHCKTFLSGILTGDFDDRILSFHFARFGLQHIMAISGFHFSFISSILGLFFNLFLSKSKASVLQIFILTIYLIFLGFQPSILRAYLMALIALLGILLKRETKALNSLGVALIFILIINPNAIYEIGFQFSFLSTASILIYYKAIDEYLQNYLAKRTLAEAFEMNRIHQHGYLILSFARQGIALTFSVNLSALPLMLYHFEQFPILSMLYNLFFPFFVSISIFLLILQLFIPFISPIDKLSNTFTKFVLDYTYNAPLTLDYKIYSTFFSFEKILLFYSFLLITTLFVLNSHESKTRVISDFKYI